MQYKFCHTKALSGQAWPLVPKLNSSEVTNLTSVKVRYHRQQAGKFNGQDCQRAVIRVKKKVNRWLDCGGGQATSGRLRRERARRRDGATSTGWSMEDECSSQRP